MSTFDEQLALFRADTQLKKTDPRWQSMFEHDMSIFTSNAKPKAVPPCCCCGKPNRWDPQSGYCKECQDV